MTKPSDHAANAVITALEAVHPAFMAWCAERDGETWWCATRWDGDGHVITAVDPVDLSEALDDVTRPKPAIVATDAGGWISGPCLPARGRPLLTEAVATSIARRRAPRRRWLPAKLLRRLGEVGR
jgi:hypothetical protein